MRIGDMFTCCDETSGSQLEPVLELQEKSGELAALLQLLHHPPSPPLELPRDNKFDPVVYDPASIIPLPLLKPLLSTLADKYSLEEEIVDVLKVHLLAHAPAHSLEVYGFASLHGMEWEVSGASQYVLPMASYRFEEVKVIPTVAAYHNLVRLQDFRVKALRDLLLGEELFPHGYGKCQSHWEMSNEKWDRQRKALIGRIESATDVAGEMDALTDTFQDCKMCHKACTAAVEMLAYKCRRLPRRLDQLPNLY
ncbi:hypothetical protein CPB83DRAFT_841924 [Crepidotus variabilis]|uniref:Uncharacterized protein n=1 Tax=Crepidotus variabilis TaxID=179855 RepID=A0A9P6EU57_9AGAR|nr:hypothetical protein CPB83DRAFT_841924 [Crepidotus variabilis]